MALSHPPLNVIESIDKKEVYYFAIVDIFTQYGVQVCCEKREKFFFFFSFFFNRNEQRDI